jgi:hypothetical protein
MNGQGSPDTDVHRPAFAGRPGLQPGRATSRQRFRPGRSGGPASNGT